jgi:hypothetical protein
MGKVVALRNLFNVCRPSIQVRIPLPCITPYSPQTMFEAWIIRKVERLMLLPSEPEQTQQLVPNNWKHGHDS